MIVPSPVSVMVPIDDADERAGEADGQRLARAVGERRAAAGQRLAPAAGEERRRHQRSDDERATIATLVQIDQAQMSARPTQKTIRSAGCAKASATATPRISTTVSATPAAPAKSGVKPAKSR